jgi:hypothetical protein
MQPDPRGYPGLGSNTGPTKIVHSFTPGLFLFPAQNPSHPPTPGREQKIASLAWGTHPGGARVATRRQRGWRRWRVSGGEGGGGASPASSASPAGGCRSGDAAAGPLPKTPTTATATHGRSAAAAAHGRSAAARSSRPAPLVATFSLVIASSPFSFLCFLLGFCV